MLLQFFVKFSNHKRSQYVALHSESLRGSKPVSHDLKLYLRAPSVLMEVDRALEDLFLFVNTRFCSYSFYRNRPLIYETSVVVSHYTYTSREGGNYFI